MIAQAKARREAAENQRKVDLQSKIKEVHKTTFLRDYIKDIPKALGRGVVGLGEMWPVGVSCIASNTDEYEKRRARALKSLAQPALKYLAPSSQKVGESVSSQLASGVGSTAPFFAIPLLGPAARVANLGLAGAAQLVIDLDAEKSNATPGQRSIATALNVPVVPLLMLLLQNCTI